jgi:uncharacterized repeat protein (TIGR04138 family)
MQPVSFDEVIDLLVTRDSRYHRESYFFVREALDFTQKSGPKPKRSEIRHVTGAELLDGIRAYALQQFGPMAITVLGEWGIHRCEDFGEIVFNMVETGLLAKTDRDSRDDFKGGYAFDAAFRLPFLPAARREQALSRPEQV